MPTPEDSASAQKDPSVEQSQVDTAALEQAAGEAKGETAPAAETADQAAASIVAASEEAKALTQGDEAPAVVVEEPAKPAEVATAPAEPVPAAAAEAPVTEERGAPFDEELPPTKPAPDAQEQASPPAEEAKQPDPDAAFLDQLANDFLRWPLPESVCADLNATKQGPGRVGTNLLSFIEARAMFRDVVLPHLEAGEPQPTALADNVKIKVLPPLLGIFVLELVNQVGALRVEAVDFWANGNHAANKSATEKADLLDGIIQRLAAL